MKYLTLKMTLNQPTATEGVYQYLTKGIGAQDLFYKYGCRKAQANPDSIVFSIPLMKANRAIKFLNQVLGSHHNGTVEIIK